MRFYSITEQGQVRSQNQDFLFASDQPVGTLANLFLVADGMGGHNAGEYASEYAVKAVLNEIRSHTDLSPVAILEQAITSANSIIYALGMQNSALSGMGTTMVGAMIDGNHLVAFNVGDSRLYVITKSEIRQVTRDHSVVEELVREGSVPRAEAVNHPKKNMITRAVGAEKNVRPDFFDVTLEPADQILLCSDGLTNMVDNETIFSIMHENGTIKEKTVKLVETANHNGGKDNITAIAIELTSDEVK